MGPGELESTGESWHQDRSVQPGEKTQPLQEKGWPNSFFLPLPFPTHPFQLTQEPLQKID